MVVVVKMIKNRVGMLLPFSASDEISKKYGDVSKLTDIGVAQVVEKAGYKLVAVVPHPDTTHDKELWFRKD
jgi:hypothetical protein